METVFIVKDPEVGFWGIAWPKVEGGPCYVEDTDSGQGEVYSYETKKEAIKSAKALGMVPVAVVRYI